MTQAADKRMADLEAINQFLFSIGSITDNLVHGPDAGKPLYHYTDLGGLIGIVQNHDLWLTHSRFSNDAEEMKLGYRIAQEEIAKQRKELSTQTNSDRIEYLDILAQALQESVTSVYVCCFCLTGDLLSQWRGYSANGMGVCMEFNWEQFNYVAGFDSPPGGLLRLWNVSYKEETHAKILSHAIDYAGNQLGLTPEKRAHQAADYMEFFIPTFKNQDFSEELEYRLIFTPHPSYLSNRKFRVGRGTVIPYYSMKELVGTSALPLLPLTKVTVGPSANQALNYESIRLLLQSSGYGNTVVEMSDTPYRGWS